MPQSNITSWLEFALQQMAAESYLDTVNINIRDEVETALIRGNNRPGFDPATGPLLGKTQMTDVLADRFLDRYQILDHHANDATGFSATLLRDRTTGEYTLSFRSTEYRHQADGGDYERDGANGLFLTGADGEIFTKGFAFGQVAAMEHYYQTTVKSVLPAGAVLNVTGYSLGAHLATVFTELHGLETNTGISFGHTYTFNGPGRGEFSGGQQPETAEADRMRTMIARLTEVLTNPMAGIESGTPEELWPPSLNAALSAWQQDPTWDPWASGSTLNAYTDARYLWAKQVIEEEFSPVSRSLSDIPRTDGAFSLITQIVGHATQGDTEYVANSGHHAVETRVYIEDQPDLDGFGGFFGASGDFGTTHSLTLIVDSLALQELFQTLSPTLERTQIEAIFAASSNQLASGFVGASGAAEGNSLENALDALGTLFVPNYTPTQFGRQTGDFGSLGFRNSFYANLAAVKTALAGQTYHIEPFLTVPGPGTPGPVLAIPADVLQARASENSDRGLAYRYALKSLNPFAVLGTTSESQTALYAQHTSNGALDLLNDADGTGTITAQYLTDRALFLTEKIALNQLDHDMSSRSVHYVDVDSNYEIRTPLTLALAQREFLFGSDDLDTLTGGGKDDHLYGGGGVDVLIGNAGRDYLEGNGGSDRLEGGAGADTMVGGSGNDTYLVEDLGDQVIEVGDNGTTDTVESSVTFSLAGTTVEHLTLTGTADLPGTGNELDNLITGNSGVNRLDGKAGADHLIGGLGNDILVGGTGDNDLLEGGAGFDTYVYNSGDGTDRIEDADAQGRIVFNGSILQGGVSTDGGNTYHSLDGSTRYVLSGGHLIVNGVLTVNQNFQSGQLGIRLTDVTEATYDNGLPTTTVTGMSGNDTIATGGGPGTVNHLVQAGDGDDFVLAGANNDQLFGEAGHDTLLGNSGQDRLDGGLGNDFLAGDNDDVSIVDGDDRLDGGEGDDQLVGGWGDDVLYGGAGTDLLYGDTLGKAQGTFTADDYLDGGGGADELHGLAGNDVLFGGADNDVLSGEEGDDVEDGGTGDDLLLAYTGNDALAGGAGIDKLYGDQGNDVLDGGSENDELYGGDGADDLYGGTGDDLLLGDHLNNPSEFSTAGGADFLDGGDGTDHLEGGLGDDTLFGGNGNDVLFGQEGNDSLFGDDGDDELQGGVGNDLLAGDAGNDRLFGQEGSDTLYGDDGDDGLAGYEGNDTLIGGVGQDVLEGGAGDDTLVGGAGSDTYLFNLGDGYDTITDTVGGGEGNLIQFGSGITLQSLTFTHDPVQQTLTIQVGAGGDSIQLLGFDPNSFQYGVQTLAFADGSDVALSSLLPLPSGFVSGTDASDLIHTGSDDDVVDAGDGDDLVDAGAGNDVLLGGAGNDTLIGGGGDDILDGGPGNDQLVGDAGADTFLVGGGSGQDTIGLVDTGDTIQVAAGISPNSVTVMRSGNNLVLNVAGTADRLTLVSFFASPANQAGQVQFADGTVWDTAGLIQQALTMTGTEGPDILQAVDDENYTLLGLGGDDVLTGRAGHDVLEGGMGNDTLSAANGADRLDGGAGDDTVIGGEGGDTYVFGLGSGHDVLQEPTFFTGTDTIQLKAGVDADDVTLKARQVNFDLDLVLSINATQDELTISSALDSDTFPIEQITFADGTIWDSAAILSRAQGLSLTAAPGGEALFGTRLSDVLTGLGGNDFLDGRAGADRMAGAGGDDQYVVDHSGDQVIELPGDGRDVVQSFVDYTLPEHVEDLQLMLSFSGASPVTGIGNDEDNELRGNGNGNVLQGGAGDDTLWGGASFSGVGGNDDLSGGAGDDTYFFDGLVNGLDTIHDESRPGEENRIHFGPLTHPNDLELVRTSTSLLISIGGGGDNGVLLADFDPDNLVGSLVVETVSFIGGIQQVSGGFDVQLADLLDPIRGTDASDVLDGTSHVDFIKAGQGDDLITGGAGNDVLAGGIGQDTYFFNVGDGIDLIDDVVGPQEGNTVRFGAGVDGQSLRLQYGGTSSQGDLTLHVGSENDALYFHGFLADDMFGPHAVERFEFVDGTVLTFDQLLAGGVEVRGTFGDDGELFGTFADDRMVGFEGAESLSGGTGNDTLDGGPGNDTLFGGTGEDTYVFHLGDGTDQLRDSFELIVDPVTGESRVADNRIVFGPGITVSDIELTDQGQGLFMRVGTSGDGINLGGYVGGADSNIQTLQFADGLIVPFAPLLDAFLAGGDLVLTGGSGENTLIGGAGNDTITGGAGSNILIGGGGHDTLTGGSGPNRFYGGAGNDLLVGGEGGNTFVFTVGGGIDTISVPVTNLPGRSRAVFGGSYSTYAPSLGLGSLVIRYGSQGDEVHIENFDPNDAYGPHSIEVFEFTDQVLTYSDLIDLGFDLAGTQDDDTLTGTNAVDRMLGFGGNDALQAGDGNDSLAGGTGNDTLRGGAGDDRYLFNLGDGTDTIEDVALAGQGNRIVFGPGITPAMLSLNQNQSTLTITVGSGGEAIHLMNFDPTGTNGSLVVETLAFADGSEVPLAGLLGPTITEGDDVIVTGTGDQVIDALGGDDTVDTGAGNDTLMGGLGNDTLIGGAGHDVLDGGPDSDLLQGGQGDDTFRFSIDGTWPSGFVAKNTGSPGYPGTGQTVNLSGKHRSFDVFSDEAGVDTLLGTAGDDAIALDDAFSPFPGSAGPRVVGIERIEVGDGNDLVDLTSPLYDYGDVSLDGGTGDDVLWAGAGHDRLLGGAGKDLLYGGAGDDRLLGGDGSDTLDGGPGADTLVGGLGNDIYVVDDAGDMVTEAANEGSDTVKSSITYTLGEHVENLTLTGSAAINGAGNALNNVLLGNGGANVLAGGAGNDTLKGGRGDDTYVFGRGDGRDKIVENDATAGNTDTLLFGAGITPLDLMLERHVNDLRMALYGTADQITIQNWYTGAASQTEVIQAGTGEQLLNTQVEQLIQAMAGFSAQTGLTWEQAIAQRPEDVQAILAANWQ